MMFRKFHLPVAGLLFLLIPRAAVGAPATEIEALGSATIAGGDAEKAKQAAYADAFRQAVSQTLAAILLPEAREQHAEVIRKRILRQARTFVTKFAVLEEGEDAGAYHVHIRATVDVAALEAELRRLKILTSGAEPVPTPTPAPVRPTVGVLIVAPEEVAAPVRAALADGLAHELAVRGFQVAKLEGAFTPVDDDDAIRRARAAGAAAVVVASAEVRDGGRIRATRSVGAELDMAVRVVDDTTAAGPTRLHEARVAAGGFGADPGAAGAAAAQAGAGRAGRAFGPALAARWPDAPAGPGGTLIVVRGVTRWQELAALVKALAATPGVERVVARALASREVTLVAVGVATTGALVDAAARTGAAARQSGTGPVEVTLAPPRGVVEQP